MNKQEKIGSYMNSSDTSTLSNSKKVTSKNYKRIGLSVVVLSAIWMTVSACGTSEGTIDPPNVMPSPTPITSELNPNPTATPKTLPFKHPLTGVTSEIKNDSRPVMVMIENSPQARPQIGLDKADIVFEIYAEGEITRFAAFYQSQNAEKIGPVRSIRPYYAELGEMLDAYIVHAGWSQDAINLIQSRKLNHFDQVYGDDKYYWRDPSRKAPHNLYTSIDRITEGASQKKYRSGWNMPILKFDYAGTMTKQGERAERVDITYLRGYTVGYSYDADKKVYTRSMNGEPHVDQESSVGLAAANILIVQAKHRVLDSEGRRAVDINGPGKGWILQQGYKLEVTWQQKDGMIRAYSGATEVPLAPGTTWVQFVPIGEEPSFL